jgi:hypothetical protein
MDREHAAVIAGCTNLSELREIIYMTKKYSPLDDLHPDDGKTLCPGIMDIFINPIAGNISSHSE